MTCGRSVTCRALSRALARRSDAQKGGRPADALVGEARRSRQVAPVGKLRTTHVHVQGNEAPRSQVESGIDSDLDELDVDVAPRRPRIVGEACAPISVVHLDGSHEDHDDAHAVVGEAGSCVDLFQRGCDAISASLSDVVAATRAAVEFVGWITPEGAAVVERAHAAKVDARLADCCDRLRALPPPSSTFPVIVLGNDGVAIALMLQIGCAAEGDA